MWGCVIRWKCEEIAHLCCISGHSFMFLLQFIMACVCVCVCEAFIYVDRYFSVLIQYSLYTCFICDRAFVLVIKYACACVHGWKGNRKIQEG